MITSKKFEGTDADLETSLFEYGLLVSIVPDKDNQYQCIYSVGTSTDDETGEDVHSNFDVGYLSVKEIEEKINESWFDKISFLSCVGFTSKEDEWLNLSFVSKLWDLLNYYGYENIMGSSYSPFDKEQTLEFINKQ